MIHFGIASLEAKWIQYESYSLPLLFLPSFCLYISFIGHLSDVCITLIFILSHSISLSTFIIHNHSCFPKYLSHSSSFITSILAIYPMLGLIVSSLSYPLNEDFSFTRKGFFSPPSYETACLFILRSAYVVDFDGVATARFLSSSRLACNSVFQRLLSHLLWYLWRLLEFQNCCNGWQLRLYYQLRHRNSRRILLSPCRSRLW